MEPDGLCWEAFFHLVRDLALGTMIKKGGWTTLFRQMTCSRILFLRCKQLSLFTSGWILGTSSFVASSAALEGHWSLLLLHHCHLRSSEFPLWVSFSSADHLRFVVPEMQQYRLIELISIVITSLVYSRNDSIITYFGNVFVDLLALLDLRSNRGDLLAK